jgi:hypothetical protein
MDPDAIVLFRELADRSSSEREQYYARHQVPAAVRTEMESLLRYLSFAIHNSCGPSRYRA